MIEGTVVLLPALLVAAAYALIGWRAGLSGSRIGLGLVAIGHASAVVALTLFPLPVQREVIDEGRALQYASNNFVPVLNTIGALAAGREAAILRQGIGNLLALAPLGLYGPLLWRGLRGWQPMLVAGIGASMAVEVAQLLISTGLGYTYRVADIDDVIINAAGVMAAYGIYRLLSQPESQPKESARGT